MANSAFGTGQASVAAHEAAGNHAGVTLTDPLGALVARQGASESNVFIAARVGTDTVDRIDVQSDGKVIWGPGNAAIDTNLYRAAADVLKTDDAFMAALGVLGVLGTTFRSGRYYDSTFGTDSASSGIDPVDGLLVCSPVIVGRTTSFDRIAIEHTATTQAGATMRLGVYSDTNGRPGTLVLDAGTIDLSTAAALKEITIDQSLTPGIYWLGAARQGTAGTAAIRAYTSRVGHMGLGITGTDSPGGSSEDQFWAMSQASVTGALPNPFTGTTYLDRSAATVPIVWLRAA